MSGDFKNLETLVALAGVQSSEERCELLHGVTELFFTTPEHRKSQGSRLSCGIMQKAPSDLEPDSQNGSKPMMCNGHSGGASNSSQAERFISEKEHFHELDANFLVNLLRDNKFEEFAFGFARLSDVDVSTARRILEDPTAEALAIACKANRFDRETFSAIVLLSDMSKMRQSELVDRLMQLYDQVTVQTAQRTMRFWRVRHAARNGPGTPAPNIHPV